MSEGEGYQIVTGIVKVIRPQGKYILGIADGVGQFLWLPEAEVIVAHPNKYESWQTTMFAVKATYNVSWKPEKNWEQYKGSYNPTNIKPLPQPVPRMFLVQPATVTAPQPQPQPKAPIQPASVQITQTAPQIPIQQVQSPIANKFVGLRAPDFIEIIAKELTLIRQILELLVKPPKFQTADVLTEEQIFEEYGAPPEINEVDNNNQQVNKDGLPSIF